MSHAKLHIILKIKKKTLLSQNSLFVATDRRYVAEMQQRLLIIFFLFLRSEMASKRFYGRAILLIVNTAAFPRVTTTRTVSLYRFNMFRRCFLVENPFFLSKGCGAVVSRHHGYTLMSVLICPKF